MKIFKQKSKQQIFWKWFIKNSDAYYNLNKDQNTLFGELKNELDKIDPSIVFEFSPILSNKKREFIISADGVKSIFPIVEDLVSKAPKLDKWIFIAFRQPKSGIDQINYGTLHIRYDDVFFRYAKDCGKIALELHLKNYTENMEWTNAIFILLDNLIGEYNTEMKLSKIDKIALDEQSINTKKLIPIRELPNIIDEYLAELNN